MGISILILAFEMLIVSGNGGLCIQMFILFYEKKKIVFLFLVAVG